MSDPHVFASKDITVTWSKRRCIHAAECVRGLPGVFEPGRKPWVVPESASAEEIAEIIMRCPTGALHFERHDGGAAETPDAENVVRVTRHGPLELRGDLEIGSAAGAVLRETRVSLCRCGRSRHKPFCDGSHHPAGFRDPGEVFEGRMGPRVSESGPLRILARANGPLRLAGPLAIMSADGRVRRAGGEVALCRCGQSRNKPFCDGSHKEAAFVAEELKAEPGEPAPGP